MTPPRRAAELALISSEIGGMRVGVPAERVLQISAWGPDAAAVVEADETVDLARRWNLDPGAAGEVRRRLRVQVGARLFDLVVGESVEVMSIRGNQVAPLPAFLQGLRHAAAISGVWLFEQQLSYLIDLDRLVPTTGQAQGGRRG